MDMLKSADPHYSGLPAPVSVPLKPFNKAAFMIRVTLLGLVILSIYGFITFDYRGVNTLDGLLASFKNFKVMFTQAHFKHLTFGEALYGILVTVGLAFLTTLFGGIIALFLGLFAARNLSNNKVSNIIKSIAAFIRAVPTVLWVLIFAVAAGLGSVAAVVGMTFHSVSYLIKAYSESFEELDEGVIEALKGSGANWWQIVNQAVLPTALTSILSWTFFRFEINFGVAVAMGAAAGAGGIGFDMFMASSYYLDLGEIGMITYFILAFAILLEVFATKLKARLHNKP
ncbi:phosphonate transport system permease protein [Paenibacillus eucommiae]|uniref:Phosphonate transport system permease protein n=2 Tax=Paenibacillus eucommiae TaxID=1355755 RepID=A0ABS4IX36_9BACL|nr:phosphonate transport system permease protein [Paenibacillus eucommiae]